MKALVAVTSLLLSTALLLIGQGMQLTLVPLRASDNGLSDFLIGVSASCYFLGFIVGCIGIPATIARAGHIRSFSVLTAVMISAVLCLEMLDGWPFLLGLRFLVGVAISGLYTVIESWLNSQASAESRGRILSIYTFILLASIALGQALINVGPVASATPFMLAAVFLALAIIPVGLTRRMAPAPLEPRRIRFNLLYQRSRTAFAGALLSGLVVGSFWSLGAVFARGNGASQSEVSWFISAAIVGGALLQYPIGLVSDRIDRRRVLLALCLGGAAASVAVALSTGHAWHLPTVFLFGAMVMPLYAISLATAADVAQSDEFVEIGTSVLLLNALGAVSAPLFLGQLMSLLGPPMLFWSFALLCLLFAAYVTRQLRDARAVSVVQQVPFTAASPDVAPASFELDPRGEEHAQAGERPADD
ncbi:MAG: MFS transporter [Pseudomonadales bacterium]|nr:MFS transporter [Halieaceae bacterium]MCP5164505.1 MFS transporter [Pseudomonadales bacterium]MCP5190110.1 MFS transporter [Pseudomonadales bacterium]MCP5204359.1 MFS transporter [Pseudomonadales bacterium]